MTAIQSCTRDCQIARQAAADAHRILQDSSPDRHWVMEVWAIQSPPGEIRVTFGGGFPSGRVSSSFKAKWWRAVEKAAREMAEQVDRLESGGG